MKIKTSNLTGVALDWAVAKCEGEEVRLIKGQLETLWTDNGYKPSTDWALAGPIIEREKICLWSEGYEWEAKIQIGVGEWVETWGSTPLIAAMRCYVASNLGDEVDVVDELHGKTEEN